MKRGCPIIVAILVCLLAARQQVSADVEARDERSLEWLVDSSDAIALGKWEAKQADMFRTTQVLKEHKSIRTGQIFKSPADGVKGEEAMFFFRTGPKGVAAFHVLRYSSPPLAVSMRKDSGASADPKSLEYQDDIAFDIDGHVISTRDDLFRRISQRVRGGPSLPPDCDREAVEAGKSLRGGYYRGVGCIEQGAVYLSVLVPIDPKIRESLEQESRRYLTTGEHVAAQSVLLANPAGNRPADRPKPGADFSGAIKMARAVAARGIDSFRYQTAAADGYRARHYRISSRASYLCRVGNPITIVECTSGKVVYQGASHEVRCADQVIFDPAERCCAWRSAPGVVSVFDLKEHKLIRQIQAGDAISGFYSLAVLRYDVGIVAINVENDPLGSVWSLETGKRLFTAAAAVWDASPSGKFIVLSARREQSCRVVGAKTGKLVFQLAPHFQGLAFDSHDEKVAYFCEASKDAKDDAEDKPVQLIVKEVEGDRVLKTFRLSQRPDRLEFTDDGGSVLCIFDQFSRNYPRRGALQFNLGEQFPGELGVWGMSDEME